MFRPTLTPARDERKAWFVWLGLSLTLAMLIARGDAHSVLPHYRDAGERWIDGEPLYNGHGWGFLYLPQAAILQVPLSLVPRLPAEIIWRCVSIAVYALGLRSLCRVAEAVHGVRLFPLATCMAVPLCLSSARNGQATVLLTGVLLLAVEAIALKRWGRATRACCLALAVKPLALPFLLVAGACNGSLRRRLLPALIVLFAVPFLMQDPAYVLEQYRGFLDNLRPTRGLIGGGPWAHLFGMLQLAGLVVPGEWQTVVRVAAAGAALAVGALMHRRLCPARRQLYLFALIAVYVMLFGPRTENNTYSLLAPAVAVLGSEAWLVRRSPSLGVMYLLTAISMAGSYELGKIVAPTIRAVWLAPLATVCFSVIAASELMRDLRRRNGGVGGQRSPAVPIAGSNDRRVGNVAGDGATAGTPAGSNDRSRVSRRVRIGKILKIANIGGR
ncbi:MAG: glycosyltransferase family 87 protein [Planctomycetaceae bacterium]